jgi:hypothetical protein
VTGDRRKRQLFGAAAVVGGLVVSLLGGEVACRVLLKRYWDTDILRERLAASSIKPLVTLDDDPVMLYGLRPGLDTVFGGSRVIIDAEGYRRGRDPIRPSEDAVRIALLGDSSSFGWHVDYEDTYGEQLRVALEEIRGGPVELRNYSVPGYNAAQELRAFSSRVTQFDPHIVIVHHDHNDAQPTGWGYDAWMAPEHGDNVLHSALLKVCIRAVTKMSMPDLADEPGDNELLGDYITAGPLYDAMLRSRQDLADTLRARGVPAVAVIYHCDVKAHADFRSDPTFARLHEGLARRLERMGYHVLDLYPRYQRLLAASGLPDLSHFWIAPDDAHPNAAGHSFIAAELAEFVRNDPELLEALRR